MSQKFCNVLVAWSTIWQVRMLLPRSWKWQTTLDSKIPSSCDTLWVLLDYRICLYGLEPWIPWFKAFLTLPIVKVLTAWEKFLETSVTNCAFTFRPTNVFGCFCGVRTRKIYSNLTKLHVHLCGFQIIHRMKECTTCQRTNYDVTNHSLCSFSHIIYVLQASTEYSIYFFFSKRILWTFRMTWYLIYYEAESGM